VFWVVDWPDCHTCHPEGDPSGSVDVKKIRLVTHRSMGESASPEHGQCAEEEPRGGGGGDDDLEGCCVDDNGACGEDGEPHCASRPGGSALLPLLEEISVSVGMRGGGSGGGDLGCAMTGGVTRSLGLHADSVGPRYV
jgi:hypothetical protein